MSNSDLFFMSFRNLFKRKVRTFLTLLGVIVGTAAIIIMISIGIALNESFEQNVANMGNIRIMTVYNPNSGGGGMMYMGGGSSVSSSRPGMSGAPKEIVLDDKAIDALKSIKNIDAVTPTAETYIYAKSGKYVTGISVKGIDPSVMSKFGYKLTEGDYLRSGEKMGIVFGASVLQRFRDPNDMNWWMKDTSEPVVKPFEDKINASYDWEYAYPQNNPFDEEPTVQKPKPFQIYPKGILEPMDWETDYYAYMDIKEVQKLKADTKRYEDSVNRSYGGYSGGQKKLDLSVYDNAMVKVDDIKNVKAVKEAIEALGFYANSQYVDMLDEMNAINSSFQSFLGILGVVSLAVAAIGIANTMIMSIYERTKEIGIMKVIGASIRDIKRLFLLESALIGFIGGICGLLLSYLISYILNKTGLAFMDSLMGNGSMGMGSMGENVSVIPVWLSPAALLFSSMVGLVSGYFPARRATKLSALAAIRTE